VKIKGGSARNFLIPNKYARRACSDLAAHRRDGAVDRFAGPGKFLGGHMATMERCKMKAELGSAICLNLIGQLLLGVAPDTILSVAAVVFVYFLGFNIFEASQPSLVSKLVPGTREGAATGVCNTT
jgi:hypothetical protein